MATKLTDRERKYRAEAIKAKGELRAMKDRASEMAELREMFLNTLAAIRSMQAEQKDQAKLLHVFEGQLMRVHDYASKDRELFKEVNAHLWRSGNRLDGVRDILLKRLVEPNVRPSWWQRLLKRLNNLIR